MLLKVPSVLACLVAAAVAVPAPGPAPPGPTADGNEAPPLGAVVVDMASGTRVLGSSVLGVESFNGIPFADPPVGPLRLRPPRRFSGAAGTVDGRGVAAACPQMMVSSAARDAVSLVVGAALDLPMLRELTGQEDCLTVNVQRPAGTGPDAKLPVLVWIFGGAFEFGASSVYDGTSLLTTAVDQDQPFVLVAVNYRVGGFGFLPGREVLADGAANLGLLDQRMALEWVADHIAAFGGDRDKVTLWGVSAGAMSVLDQMLLYGGNATYHGRPLFRGAIMNSGGVAPADPVDCPKAQAVYDAVVARAGCGRRPDSLACLRELPYETLLAATNAEPSFFSYSALALSYLPRPDGVALPDSPERLMRSGRFHAVPIIVGNQEDEGTVVSVFQWNLTTADDVAAYLSDLYFVNLPPAVLRDFVSLYEPGWLQGSPFRTGVFNELYPGFKRLSAVLGDLVFTLARRAMLKDVARVRPDMPVWSYLASYNHHIPFVGTFHASDVLRVFFALPSDFATQSCRTYYFNFLYHLDPNEGVGGYDAWPRWNEARELMWFRWPWANDRLKDDFRSGAEAWLDRHPSMLHM